MRGLVVTGVAALAACLATPGAEAQTRRARAETPIEALAAANGAARQRPTRDGFDQARQVYAYQPGALYELYAHPNFVSTILLEPGELVANIAAGDTSRWMVSQAEGESGGEGRTIVLVKPQASNLRTNIVLITDRRTYLIEAVSQSGAVYSAQVSWSYPEHELLAPTAPIDGLNFNYRVRTVRGRAPVWSPSRVFDDGRRTWVEFGAHVASAELPPLFVMSGEGVEITNYRTVQGPNGPRYMIDRVFDVAELRLGARAPVIVRIERNPSDRRLSQRRSGRG